MLDRPKPAGAPSRSVTRGRSVQTQRINGSDVHVVPPLSGAAATSGSVIYLHGGSCTVRQQWALIAEIADRAGVDVVVPVYGLAPRHRAEEAIALVAAVIDGLRTRGRRAYLVGDSAGGGLAFAALQEAQRAEPGRVAGATLISPWLDLAMRNPEIPVIERVDPWLSRPALRVSGHRPASSTWRRRARCTCTR